MELREYCTYRNDRINSDELNTHNYISTENLLPNKGGITEATSIPTGNVVRYDKGNILISNIRPYFKKIWLADKSGGCSADVLCIQSNDKVTSKFLYYLLSQQSFFDYVMAGAKGCKMPRGDKSHIMEWNVNIPDIDEQKRIADFLSSLDDKIELNRQINDNLEQQAQALFKSWFVDFEPFKDGEFIESELGMIPKGWRVGTLSDIINFESGFAFKSDTFCDNGEYRLITIKGVQDGYLDINGAVFIDSLPYRMPSYCNLNEGDIIMSLTGNVGRCCIVDRPNLLLNQRVVKLSPRNSSDKMIIYAMFRRTTFKEKLIALSRGTAQANLSPIETANLSIIIPDESALLSFNNFGNAVFISLLNNIHERIALENLRETLLPRLMSGELKIDEINC